jgi:hypothetical protein
MGWYEGEPMLPWVSQLVVRDTVLGEEPALAITYNSRDEGAGWLFVNTTAVRKRDLHSAGSTWIGNGRQGHTRCDAVVEDGMVRITDDYGDQVHGPYEGTLLPVFALAPVIAATELTDGMSIRLRPYQCGPGSLGQAVLHVWDLEAVVTAATETRPSGDTDVWLVRSERGYRIELVIAQSDRTVQRITTYPAGSGRMVEEHASME